MFLYLVFVLQQKKNSYYQHKRNESHLLINGLGLALLIYLNVPIVFIDIIVDYREKMLEFKTNLIPTISNKTANAFFNVAAGNL